MKRYHLQPPAEETWVVQSTRPQGLSRNWGGFCGRMDDGEMAPMDRWLDRAYRLTEELTVWPDRTRVEAAASANALYAHVRSLHRIFGIPEDARPNMGAIPNLDTAQWNGRYPWADAGRAYKDLFTETAMSLCDKGGNPVRDVKDAAGKLWTLYACTKYMYQARLWAMGLYGQGTVKEVRMRYV